LNNSEVVLGLPEYQVIGFGEVAGRVYISARFIGAVFCPDCQGQRLRLKDKRIRQPRHDSLRLRPCVLEVESRKWWCRDCRRKFWDRLPGILPHKRPLSRSGAASTAGIATGSMPLLSATEKAPHTEAMRAFSAGILQPGAAVEGMRSGAAGATRRDAVVVSARDRHHVAVHPKQRDHGGLPHEDGTAAAPGIRISEFQTLPITSAGHPLISLL